MAKVKGGRGEKVYFYGDERDCPKGKNCRLKSYLVGGDEVIVSRSFGDYACTWFQSAKGRETVGWIPLKNLEFVETEKNPPVADWLGEWFYYDNSIEISRDGSAENLTVRGNAFWKGIGDNVHIGEIDDAAKPSGGELKIGEDSSDEYECRVTMRLLGKFLIVSDNFRCGGANVTFSGVYRKRK